MTVNSLLASLINNSLRLYCNSLCMPVTFLLVLFHERLLTYQLSRAPEGTSYFGNQSVSHELDLSLSSLWFTKSPATLPPSIIGTQGKKIHASSSGWSSTGSRKTYTYTTIVQDNINLSRHIIELTWDASNPGVTVKARQKYIPPPRSLSWDELEAYRHRYAHS